MSEHARPPPAQAKALRDETMAILVQFFSAKSPSSA